MIKLVILSVIQSICLASGNLLMKVALNNMPAFSWTRDYFFTLLTNWWFLLTGIVLGSATVLWFHILKNYPFSAAYPLTCMSYVFGMFAALIFLNEAIPLTRWIGIGIIIVGVYFVAK